LPIAFTPGDIDAHAGEFAGKEVPMLRCGHHQRIVARFQRLAEIASDVSRESGAVGIVQLNEVSAALRLLQEPVPGRHE
jgi:hypothetical protein